MRKAEGSTATYDTTAMEGARAFLRSVSFPFFFVNWASLLMTICRICASTHWRARLSRKMRCRRRRRRCLPPLLLRRSLNMPGTHNRSHNQRAMHKLMCTLALDSGRPGYSTINHRPLRRLRLRHMSMQI